MHSNLLLLLRSFTILFSLVTFIGCEQMFVENSLTTSEADEENALDTEEDELLPQDAVKLPYNSQISSADDLRCVHFNLRSAREVWLGTGPSPFEYPAEREAYNRDLGAFTIVAQRRLSSCSEDTKMYLYKYGEDDVLAQDDDGGVFTCASYRIRYNGKPTACRTSFRSPRKSERRGMLEC